MVPELDSSQMGHGTIMEVHSPSPLNTKSKDLQDVCNIKLMGQIMNILERMEKRQALQDQRITELHQQLVSTQSSTQGFPQFQLFPPEIRCHIWEMAIPRRTLRPYRRFRSELGGCPEDWADHWRLPPPVIAQVCRESRSIALQRGGLYFLSHRNGKIWTWFDGSRDLLDLSGRCPDWSRFRGIGSLIEKAETILLHTNAIEDRWVCGFFEQSSFQKRARTIYLQTEDTLVVDKNVWHPHAVARLFGRDLFVTVELEDKDQSSWLRDILATNWPNYEGRQFDLRRHADTYLRLVEVIRGQPSLKAFNEAKEAIVKTWLSHGCMGPLPRDCFEEDGSVKEAKLWNCAGMPHIRLVQSFERRARCAELDFCRTGREEDSMLPLPAEDQRG